MTLEVERYMWISVYPHFPVASACLHTRRVDGERLVGRQQECTVHAWTHSSFGPRHQLVHRQMWTTRAPRETSSQWLGGTYAEVLFSAHDQSGRRRTRLSGMRCHAVMSPLTVATKLETEKCVHGARAFLQSAAEFYRGNGHRVQQ